MFWWESKVCWESRFCRVSRGRVTWHSEEEEGALLFCSCCRLLLRCCNVTGTADASRNEVELELVDANGLLIIEVVTG